MRRSGGILALVLLVALAPTTLASGAPACDEITEEQAIAVDDRYVRVDSEDRGLEVWEETNGIDGLQAEPCTDGDGREIDPDEHVETLPPALPGLPGVPSWLEDPCAELVSPIIPSTHISCGLPIGTG